MSSGQPYNARPCDLVQVTSALDGLTHYVRRRELLGGKAQKLATFSGFGDPRTWGPAGLPREHVIFEDHDDAIVTLQMLFTRLDGFYDAAVANQDCGDDGCFVTLESIREMYQATVETLAAAGS